MHTSTKSLIAYAAIALVAALAAGSLIWAFSTKTADAGGQITQCWTLAGSSCPSNASTTPSMQVYQTTSTASTTLTAATGNSTSLALNVDETASSTSSVILFSVQFSDNGVDWYQEDANATASNVETHTAVALYHTWTPGTTAEQFRRLNINAPTASRFTRVRISTNGANAKIHPELILQNAIVN